MKTAFDGYLYGISINLSAVHSNVLNTLSLPTANRQHQQSFEPKELEYIKWHIEGKTACEIAQITRTPKKTVEWRLTKIRKQLNCQKSTQLAYLFGRCHGHFTPQISHEKSYAKQ